MAEESFTKVTTRSWGSRVGQSFKSTLFGIMLVIAAFPVQFMNEGRAVDRAKALEEGAGAVVSISSEEVDPANEGKLVHLFGRTAVREALADSEFPVSVKAIKLLREVEMFQWQERTHSETREKLGGSTETVTTYTYAKAWGTTPVDASTFQKPQGHTNPASMAYQNRTYRAKEVQLGAFRLNLSLIGRMSHSEEVSLTGKSTKVPYRMAGKRVTLQGSAFYLGRDPANPQVGDLRIRFKAVMPATVSVVSQQQQNSFVPYVAKTGEVELLEYGESLAAAMFKGAHKRNVVFTWIIRGIGFLLLYIGLSTILAPLHTLGAVVPLIGNILEFGTRLLAFVLAAALSLITVSIAWIFYRPLLGIGLLVVGLAIPISLKFLRQDKAASDVNSTGGE